MKIDLFDRYDIRTRICAFIFVLSPFLLDAYILVDAIRNFSSTVIISVVLIAGSGLATCWMRYMGNTVKQDDLIAEYLTPNSTVIDANTKARYHAKLAEREPKFADLSSDDPQVCQAIAKDISSWLKEKTRDKKYSLIHEENLNYGFIRNLYAMKTVFLGCFSVYTFFLLGLLIFSNWELTPKDYFATIPAEHVTCMILHVTFYLIWIFGITMKILNFAAKKYALAVIRAIDTLQ